jgi:predicted SnoaL-like aldol condensation-catalyzing enzyme
MKNIILSIALSMAAMASNAQVPVTPGADQQAMLKSSDPKVAANKKLVFDFWREVFEAGHMENIDRYMAESYIQHNPMVATGRKPFVDFFSMRFRSGAKPVEPTVKQPLVTILGDGDYVTMVFVRELPHPSKQGEKYTTTWFDMFRIENGKIAEHWDPAELRAPPAAAPIAPKP